MSSCFKENELNKVAVLIKEVLIGLKVNFYMNCFHLELKIL